MRIIAAVSLFALALAGCQKAKVDETNASIEEVANAVAESKVETVLKPGRWEATAELVDLTAPNLPPQAKDMMAKQMAAASSKVAICLRPEDVNKPNAGFFGQDNKDCRFDHYRMGGGTIDAKMRCAVPSGGESVTEMSGTYGPERYEMNVTSTMTAGQPGPMTMKMRMVSSRVGECTGSEMQGAPTKA